MARYKNPQHLHQSNDTAFDVVHSPGAPAPQSGIYRCVTCGDEVASNAGQPLPPQNPAQHNPARGPVQWQLIVDAEQQR